MVDSYYRPFGLLPNSTDVNFSIDKKYGVFSVALIVGTVIAIHMVFLIIALIAKWRLISNRQQQNNLILIFISEFFLLCGLVDIAASAREYPSDEPLYGQIFGTACIMAQTFFFLPAMFLKPLFQGTKIGFYPGEKIIIGVNAGLAIIIIALEIAVIATGANGTLPKGLLYALFSFQLACVLIETGFGIYSILAKFAEKEKNDPLGPIDGGTQPAVVKISARTSFRITYLIFGMCAVILYIVFHSLESPDSLVMRGLEIISLFILVIIDFFFTWSLVKTVGAIAFAEDTMDADDMIVNGKGYVKGAEILL